MTLIIDKESQRVKLDITYDVFAKLRGFSGIEEYSTFLIDAAITADDCLEDTMRKDYDFITENYPKNNKGE